MRSHTLAACAAVFALASAAPAQNTLELANPLAQWRRAAPSAGSYQAVTYKYDDGSSDNAIGINCGVATCAAPGTSTLVWAHYFDTNDPTFAGTSSDTITRVDVAIGNPPGPTGPPAGAPFNVYIFDDPNDDGSPLDLLAAHLVTQGSGISNMPDTDIFEQVAVPPGVVQGGFFVIATMVHQMGTTPATPGLAEFPGALDQTLPNPPPPPRVWANCFNGTWAPSNPQASSCGGWIDLQTLFAGVWLLRAEGTGSGPTTFCTAKAGLVCGTPAISATGASSVASSSGFVVSAGPARQNKSGILLLNTSLGATPVPYEGGTLCVNPTGLRRAGSTNSGAGCSPASCNGTFSIDMNTWGFAPGAGNNIWVVPDCNGAPSGIPPNNAPGYMQTPGTTIFCQYWGRDSVATGSFVSDGLNYTIGT